MITDKYGRRWPFPRRELCQVCRQPDSCGDCNHKRLKDAEVRSLGGTPLTPAEKKLARIKRRALDAFKLAETLSTHEAGEEYAVALETILEIIIGRRGH